MHTRHLLAALALALSAPAFGAGDQDHDHAHEHKPLHGGVVVEAKDIDFELVARPTSLQLYLRDHGKHMDISKASAKLTLLAGAAKQEVVLTPVGDKLEATGDFKVVPGTKAVAVLTVPGKPAATARFVLK